MVQAITRETLTVLDAEDPLAQCRERFRLPEGIVYLAGNSLGAMPKTVANRVRRGIEFEWADGLVRSWNDADWYLAPQRSGARIARLVGAAPDEVIVADSTSVNLFKVLVAALRMRPGRRRILAEKDGFPTDNYICSAVAGLMGAETQFVESENVVDALDERVAVVALTHVDYRTGRAHDMQAVTEHAHRKGALVVWDLAHTAGALRCELGECQVDFAVGCGYKYLNGGPGAPGFIFVARRHLSEVRQPLTGWHGHIRPFEFEAQYTPSEGIARMLTGTAPQIGLFSLEEALKVFDDIRMEQVHAKSERMTELFMRLVWQELKGFGFRIVTPLESGRRGSQVSMTHAQGYPIVQAMIARGVIGDFRAPSTLRFGLAALYLKFVEIWEAVVALREIMERRAWDTPELRQRQLVT